jgi:hypothetical protein
MTASAKSIKGSSQGVDYLIDEKKGYELDRNLIYGDTSAEIMQSFKIQQSLNTTCDKKFITAYISPEPKDGQKLSDIELKEISRDFMKGIGVNPEKQAYLTIVHTEKNHKHIHLIINRIDENNKAIKDNFIVLKSQDTAHKIAKERGLISARDIKQQNIDKKINISKELKSKTFEGHNNVMRLKPDSMSKYIQYMKSTGYEVKPTINKAGKLQGFRIQDLKTGQDFKMSEINRSMSQQVQKLKNDLGSEKTSSKMFTAHKEVMKMKPQNLDKYQHYMRSMGYNVNLMKNKAGKIQNIMVNKTNKTVGKIFTLFVPTINNLKEKLSPEEIKNKIEQMKTTEQLMDIAQQNIMVNQILEFEKISDIKNSLAKDNTQNINL